MKRNFLTGIAMMVAAFFFGTELAQAADISFSGKIRTRYENETRTNFTANGEANDLTATQIRLNAKANINSDTSAFVQMQSTHTWGSANAAYTASDGDASVGIHQGYFTLKNFASLPLTAKIGRQEITLDGHRLFGHTGWTTGAQTHDAVRLTHSHDNMTMTYAYSMAQEITGTATMDRDNGTHVVHTNFQGVLGGALSTYVVFVDDDCNTLSGATACEGGDSRWFTLGARQAGKIMGLDYRAEYYHQLGAAGGARNAIAPGNVLSSYNTAHGAAGYGEEATRDAFMFGARLGKSFSNITGKPKVTLWYDYLSGNSDEDMNNGDWAQFDTLYDTGHKYYGFMDLFLSNVGAGVNYMGLQDIAIKLVLKPAAKWTLKADLHNFRLAESVGGNPSMATRTGIMNAPISSTSGNVRTNAGDRSLGTELGSELDITLVHAYNPNVKLVFGYSQFMAETLYHLVDANSAANGYDNVGRWAYVMADVKF